jgi:hypothetical protein
VGRKEQQAAGADADPRRRAGSAAAAALPLQRTLRAELFEALRATGDYRGERPLFEVRDALLDWNRIAPRKGRYHVLLSAQAEVADPAVREASVRAFMAAAKPALLGTSAQIAALGPAVGKARVFIRTSPGDLDRAGDGVTVLHDAHLGYLGARHRACGRVHVNWRRLHVRQTLDGLLFTMLCRRRPTLVDIVVSGTAHLSVSRCRIHHSPIILAEGGPR